MSNSMKTKTSRRAAFAGASAALTLLAAHGAAAQGAAGSNDRGVVLEEIIVTAQKRTEVLREIPQSVTVINSATLERQQADNLQDYLALVPGLSLEGSTRGVSRITLRGVNTGGVASTVGVYVDEVPFGSSSGLANGSILAGDFDTFDVARLEVLRGPQGTLYGASSLGGVLKFVTNAPQMDAFESKVQVGVESVSDGDLSYSGTGVVNVPLSERLAIRASGFYRLDGGFIDSVGIGPVTELDDGTLTGPPTVIIPGSRVRDDVNELKTFGGRMSALFQASDAFSVRLTALAQNIESAASDYVEVDRATLEPLYGGLTLAQYHPEFTDIEYRVYSATLDGNLGFANLLSSTSYSTFQQTFLSDFALGLAPLATYLYGDADARPLSVILEQGTGTDKFTQELRLSSPDNETFEWLVGAFYTREKSAIDPQKILAVEAGTETLAADVPVLLEAFLGSEFEEYAAFANATWHVTPRFDLAFGGRASRNEQRADLLIAGDLNGEVTEFSGLRSEEDVFTYSVAPRFELSEDASIYARVATGYRPGGPNVIPPDSPPGTPFTYDADSLTSYELGLKADWFDRRFSLDVAAYFLDWDDVQLFAVINDTGINANGGTAESKGVELTAMALPMPGLSLTLTGAYTDAYLTEDTDPVVGGLNGDQLPYVPELSLNLSGDYEWTVFGNAMAYVGASVRSVRDQVGDFGVRTDSGAQRGIPSYEVIDLRAGIDTGRWSVELFVKNLDDELGRTSLFGDPGVFPADAMATGVIRPRTIGVTLGASF